MKRWDLSRYGSTALVTGASSGIGAAFARVLSDCGLTVIAVARRLDRLETLAKQAEEKGGGTIHPLIIDLAQPDSGLRVEEAVRSLGVSVDLLVNNAGYGLLGEFPVAALEREAGMIDLNCRAVLDLTARFVPGMKARKRGGIIVVSSVVGTLPVPWFATYAATKAFDLYFAEALHAELKEFGIDVTAILPGLTKTEFQAGAGMERTYHSPYRSAEQVVETALHGLLQKKSAVVDGWHNKLLVHGSRFLPRSIVVRLSAWVMRKELKKR